MDTIEYATFRYDIRLKWKTGLRGRWLHIWTVRLLQACQVLERTQPNHFQLKGGLCRAHLSQSRQEESCQNLRCIFTCDSAHVMNLKLCKDLCCTEFERVFFVARRGVPNVMVIDNAKTFKATDDVKNYFANHCIKWNFHLSRAP